MTRKERHDCIAKWIGEYRADAKYRKGSYVISVQGVEVAVEKVRKYPTTKTFVKVALAVQSIPIKNQF